MIYLRLANYKVLLIVFLVISNIGHAQLIITDVQAKKILKMNIDFTHTKELLTISNDNNAIYKRIIYDQTNKIHTDSLLIDRSMMDLKATELDLKTYSIDYEVKLEKAKKYRNYALVISGVLALVVLLK